MTYGLDMAEARQAVGFRLGKTIFYQICKFLKDFLLA